MKSVFIKVLRVLMLFIVIISCAVGYVVYEDTLASWWIPVGVALVIAILTLPLYMNIGIMKLNDFGIVCKWLCDS